LTVTWLRPNSFVAKRALSAAVMSSSHTDARHDGIRGDTVADGNGEVLIALTDMIGFNGVVDALGDENIQVIMEGVKLSAG
jgi:hypothetical protein